MLESGEPEKEASMVWRVLTAWLTVALLLAAPWPALAADPLVVSIWGGMLNQAQNFLQQAWWMPFFPGTAIFLTVLSFNLAGEALNEVLNPRRQP